MPEALLVVLFFALVIALIIAFSIAEKKRRERLVAFAAENGYEYFPHGDPTGAEPPGCSFAAFGSARGQWFRRFEGFSPFGVGHSQSASNLFVKRENPRTWYFFDYRYTTGSGKHQTTHSFWIAATEFPSMFPSLVVRTEGFFDKIGAFIGFRDIEFESHEFNERFHVSGSDEKFAYAVVHPQMMEFLLSGPRIDWQMGGPYLLVAGNGRLDVEVIAPTRAMMEAFLEHVPDYVWKDYGARQAY